MKKSLFFYAAAALALTACTSEDDILQTGQTKQSAPQEVGFDVYTPAATSVTRAGLEGTMTTSRLQRSEYEGGGFGVYAFQVQDELSGAGFENATGYTPTAIANFMVNEKILWNATNQGWYYSPLKYWPNETDNDSQNSNAEMLGDGTNKHIDRLTFFAYAPYVKTAETETPGITDLTNKGGYLDTDAEGTSTTTAVTEPSIGYQAALDDPNEAVDLLWGVAPAGGLTYTAVNGKTVKAEEGLPLIDMTKPDVNTNMKFLFQHALARIGVTAVAAVDQIGAGGTLDPNTKITIEKITLEGWFGETGLLNLDNPNTSVANWYNINGVALSGKSTATTVNETGGVFDGVTKKKLILAADHTTSGTDFANHQKGSIARHLQFVGTVEDPEDPSATPVAQTNRVGVTTVRQNVMMPAVIDNTLGANPANRNWYTSKTYDDYELAYSETTPYYTNINCTDQPTATVYYDKTGTAIGSTKKVYSFNDKGEYTEYTSVQTLQYPQVNIYYNVPFKEVVATVTDDTKQITAANAKGKLAYTFDTDTYSPKVVGIDAVVGEFVIDGDITKAYAYYDGDTYYKRDANYFMVVPLNNVPLICTKLDAEDLKELYKVRVMIEYYITTTDSKLKGGLAQTKNVIEKDVIFPSIANGKSYNLNLVLGLTSVKMEAEVDDWKVVNVQGDLPQNTAE